MEPQNILEGLGKKYDREGYFSLHILPAFLLLHAVLPILFNYNAPAPILQVVQYVCMILHTIGSAHIYLFKNCMFQREVQKHESNRCQNMTFPLMTTLAGSFS